MDDQHGKIIDGTARTPGWRGVRAASPDWAGDGEPRSEAPKSMAESLLVPAELIDPAAPARPDDHAPGAARDRWIALGRVSCSGGVTGGRHARGLGFAVGGVRRGRSSAAEDCECGGGVSRPRRVVAREDADRRPTWRGVWLVCR